MLNRRLLGEEEADREILFEPPQTTKFQQSHCLRSRSSSPQQVPLGSGDGSGTKRTRSALSHLLVWLPVLNPIIQSAQKAQINPK